MEDVVTKVLMHRETEKRDRGEQAVEDLDPVLGVVRWAAVAVDRVAWSRAPWWRVSHWREAVSASFGIDVTQKKEESSLCSGEERESQTRGIRESLDDDSGPRSTWRWRRNGGITHRSMWNRTQASRGWRALTPAPTCPTPTVAHSEEKMRGGQFSVRSPALCRRNGVINLRLRCVFLLRGSHQEGQV